MIEARQKQMTEKLRAKKKKENEKLADMEWYEDLGQELGYSEQTVQMFPSLKDILKQRSQFNRNKKEKKELLEKKYKHDQAFQEIIKITKSKIIKLQLGETNSLKIRKDRGDEDANDETELTGWQKVRADYEQKLAQIKDDQTFYVHGRWVKFSQRSLGLLDNKNKLRIACVWLITSKWFENLIIFVIFLNSLQLGIKDYTDPNNTSPINRFVESTEPFFTFFFLFECLTKILGMGLILGSKTYLSDAWNWLDFLVVVTSLLNELPGLRNISGLRTFRLFRPLRSLTTMPSMKLLIGTLLSSVSHLGGILGLSIFFFLIFAILGVSLWNGLTHYRCYQTQWPDPQTGEWFLVEEDQRLCGDQRQCPVGFCNSLFEAKNNGYLVKRDLWADTDIPSLNYGITNFDNIFYAFLTIFQCTTMQGWSLIMDTFEDAYLSIFVDFYFIICVVVCSFFLLNLTIAVMLMKYEELDRSQENSKHKEELRRLGESINLPKRLVEFMIKEDKIQLNDLTKRMLRQEDSFIKQLFAPNRFYFDKGDHYYQNKVVKLSLKVVLNSFFEPFIILIILINTLSMAMDKYPENSQSLNYFLNLVNTICTLIFAFEAILKLVGFGLRSYWSDSFNKFDFSIVIVSLIEMEVAGNGGGSVFSALRAFRLFKIFKLFKVGDLRILLDSISFTVAAIGDYVILLCLFIYVFALLGMSFFAGAVKFDKYGQVDLENGTSPRANFDSLGWSIITIFQVLVGEGWNLIMYDCMRSKNQLSALYFILVMLTGNIIMLNLFLAILLGNFEKARNFGSKKKVFEAFKELQVDGKSLNQVIDIVLGDLAVHTKIKIMQWDEIIVNRLHQEGDSEIAQQLMEIGAQFFEDPDEDIQFENVVYLQLNKKSEEMLKEDDVKSKMRNSAKKETEEVIEVKSEQQNTDKQEELPFNQFSQTVAMVRKYSPNLLRLRELARQFNETQTQAIKSVLQKQWDLEEVQMEKLSEDIMMERLEQFHSQKNILEQDYDESVKKEILEKETLNSNIATNSQLLAQLVSNQEEAIISQQRIRKINKAARRKSRFLKIQKNMSGGAAINSQHSILEDPLNLSQSSITKSPNPYSIKKDKSFDIESPLPRPQIVESKKTDIPSLNQARLEDARRRRSSVVKNQIWKRRKNIGIPQISQRLDDSFLAPPESFIHQQYHRFWESSLFIFHRDSFIRQKCLLLAESPEMLLEYLNAREASKFQQNDIEVVTATANSAEIEMHRRTKTKESEMVDVEDLSPFAQMGNQLSDLQKQHPSKIFDNVVLLLIILSSIMLILDNPLDDPEGNLQQILKYIDIFFTILFFIEAAIKIIAKGLIKNSIHPIEPYLKSAWNQIDAFVVFSSLVDLSCSLAGLNLSQLQALKALRALRALRPLRVISRNEGMRLVVNALLASLPSMKNVLLVCSLFILIFSIMGVNFFKGKFYSCTNLSLQLLEEVVTKQDCLDRGGSWENANANFDNVLQSGITLFQMISSEGWVKDMYNGIDGTDVDMQPVINNQIWLVAYFVGFMIIGSQFISNLFAGVVIDNFNNIKEREELGNIFVTESQKNWIEIQKIGLGKRLRTKIKEPEGARLPFFRLVRSKYYDYFITGIILLNTAVMAMRHYNMSEDLNNFSEKSNFFFTLVFNIEMILKLVGLGKLYFADSWNKFDMFIVITTDLSVLLDLIGIGGGLSSAGTVIRSVRIMRMFRLIRASVHLKLILDTINNILPQITNIMSLLILVIFIYAALAVNLFSGIMLQTHLSEKNNFQSFSRSMIMLFKFSTGGDWNDFMYELNNRDGFKGVTCQSAQTYQDIQINGIQGCGSIFAIPYLFSFIILLQMLIMNLSVAAVIEGLDTAKKENMGLVQGDDISDLLDLWQEYDPEGTGWITMIDLVFFLYQLPPPLGRRNFKLRMIDTPEDQQSQKLKQTDRYLVNIEKRIVLKKIDALEILKDLKIRVHHDPKKQVHIVDVMKALVKRIFNTRKIEYKLNINLSRKLKTKWLKKHKDINSVKRSKYTVREEQAGLIITRWARRCLYQKTQHLLKKEINKPKKTALKSSAQIQREIELRKNEASMKKRKNEILTEQAKLILEIIKGGKKPMRQIDQPEDQSYIVKNEFLWKTLDGQVILQDLERQEFEEEFDIKHLSEEQRELLENQYQLYRQMRHNERLEANKYNSDLFNYPEDGKLRQNESQISKEAVRNLTEVGQGQVERKKTFKLRNQFVGETKKIDESKPNIANEMVISSQLARNIEQIEQSYHKLQDVSIQILGLETPEELAPRSIFSYDPEQIKEGVRPERNLLAERYVMEFPQRNEDNESQNSSDSIFEQSFKEQEVKIQKMVQKMKEENRKERQLAELQAVILRPQIARNVENFKYGCSGKTIEVDDDDGYIIKDKEWRLNFYEDKRHLNQKSKVVEDIVSSPALDALLNPAVARRRKNQNQL